MKNHNKEPQLKNQSTKSIIINSIEATLGLVLFAIGVYLVIQANIGVSPWDVLTIGLSNTFGILYGNVSIAISAVIIVIDLIMGEKIGLGTILDAIVVGKTIDLLNYLEVIPKSENLWISILMLLVAFFIEGCSQFFYMQAGLCAGPRDSFQLALGRRMPKIPIGVVNIFILATVLVIGWFFDGPIGIGTLIAPFGVGLFQQLAFNLFHYDPKATKHQHLIDSFRVISGKSISNNFEK